MVYDGDCPMCRSVPKYYRLKQSVGELRLLDARSNPNHPLLARIRQEGLNLDEGFVVCHEDELFYGGEATALMWSLTSRVGLFNKLGFLIFKNRRVARFSYPIMRSVRNLLLFLLGKEKIQNLKKPAENPIFYTVFGQSSWDDLPKVLQDHYRVRANSSDLIEMTGTLDIEVSAFAKLMSKTSGALVPRGGKEIPVVVKIYADKGVDALVFDRTFEFPNNEKHRFVSRMYRLGGNQLVEVVKFGLGWRHTINWTGEKIVLAHKGYCLRVFGKFLPMPLAWLMGVANAEEIAVSGDSFAMWTKVGTKYLGKRFAYKGTLKITRVVQQE
ncbi:MAG: DUF4166 domain-containing protein [Alphaproteobacteria bacterium]